MVFPTGIARHSRFRPDILARLAESKILGLRAGTRPHRFIGIWAVVTKGRVFVRSWELSPDGWFCIVRKERVGAIQAGRRIIRVQSRVIRSQAVLEAVDAAYAAKYFTAGALKYVRGFRRGRRRATTTELFPALASVNRA